VAAREALDAAGRSDLEPKIAPPRGVVYAGPSARPVRS
jgi:hypothetical protein